jgi:cytochrome c
VSTRAGAGVVARGAAAVGTDPAKAPSRAACAAKGCAALVGNGRATPPCKRPATRAAALLAFAALLAPAAARSAPDAARGEPLYARCLACHALAYDRVGPRHCGLFGRLAGSVPGFDYSAAMRRSGIRWNEATLERFLAAPLAMVPGSTMTYAGVPDPAERADLIAYLARATRFEACSRPPR